MKLLTNFLSQWFLLLLFLFSSSSVLASSPYHQIPRLSPIRLKFAEEEDSFVSASSASNEDFQTFFYEQTLDHFNYGPESYATFKQKYFVSSKYWGGADSNSPIFAYLGAESALTNGTVNTIGFITDNASRFKALLVYIEHRFYGDSIPFGFSKEEAMKNGSIRGYFSSVQAIADYAEVLLHVKEKFSAPNSPVIVIGGSYGGMLAAWFRLKYPHIAVGALASSAPILYFDNIVPQDAYDSVVAKSFKDESESCYETIKKSWSAIDKLASQADGLSILSRRFNICTPLRDSSALKDYLVNSYQSAAQYNKPSGGRVNSICGRVDGAPEGTDIVGQIYAGIFGDKVNSTCHNITEGNASSLILDQWYWQTCSDMVMPIGNNNSNSFLPFGPFNLTIFIKDCKDVFGVPPRPHWTTTYYGGHDIKLVLQKFGSNIIFSNGLADPYSTGGVLEDLSDSLLAIYTTKGSHCMDLYSERSDDPDWLKMQRKIEVTVIEGWIAKYNADLLVINQREKLPQANNEYPDLRLVTDHLISQY